MRVEAERGMKSLRGRMEGFLQFGLVDDEVLYARELRALRTQMTRVIAELEKAYGPAEVAAGGGVGTGAGGMDSGMAGEVPPVAEVT